MSLSALGRPIPISRQTARGSERGDVLRIVACENGEPALGRCLQCALEKRGRRPCCRRLRRRGVKRAVAQRACSVADLPAPCLGSPADCAARPWLQHLSAGSRCLAAWCARFAPVGHREGWRPPFATGSQLQFASPQARSCDAVHAPSPPPPPPQHFASSMACPLLTASGWFPRASAWCPPAQAQAPLRRRPRLPARDPPPASATAPVRQAAPRTALPAAVGAGTPALPLLHAPRLGSRLRLPMRRWTTSWRLRADSQPQPPSARLRATPETSAAAKLPAQAAIISPARPSCRWATAPRATHAAAPACPGWQDPRWRPDTPPVACLSPPHPPLAPAAC